MHAVADVEAAVAVHVAERDAAVAEVAGLLKRSRRPVPSP